ncbi:hypothetical protein LCGC14_0529340 [marine sediment metagenome]|uniref:Uncharacterized protein n=1 Tax=marine sediment metagenome TaxID=412755 RepID=A0A0F9RWB3_9ZZZZ
MNQVDMRRARELLQRYYLNYRPDMSDDEVIVILGSVPEVTIRALENMPEDVRAAGAVIVGDGPIEVW